MEENIERVIFSKKQIAERIAEVGSQITEDYKDKVQDGIIVMSILKGAAIFMTDLVRAIDLPMQMDFMVVSSYYNSTKTSGRARIEYDLSCDIRDKHLLIAEDVVDSGITLATLMNHFENRGAKTVNICALLHKHIEQQPLDVKYTCFDCPKDFIVGYGLDFQQQYRNLPYIGVLKPECYEGEC